MRSYDFLQVLWVEDDESIIEPFQLEAENYDLELVDYHCWDDAKKKKEKEYDRWSAIILDAKCKFHKDSADNAVVFLREALKDISVIAKEKHRTIPWYVLSGGDIGEISDSINEDRLKWDEDWTKSKNKTFYSKNTDREDLFHRIIIHANKSPRLQIHEVYHKVFDAIEECGIDDNAYNALEDLLTPIHFSDVITDEDYNGRFKNVRTIYEYLFKAMGNKGILPDWGKKVNAQWSSCLLAGVDATVKKNPEIPEIVKYKSHSPILPKILQGILREIVNVVPKMLHAEDEDTNSNEERKGIEYLLMVDNSTYLLKSYTFQLCDLILWYRNYLKDHKDKNANMKNWEKL